MAQIKETAANPAATKPTAPVQHAVSSPLFSKENYKWMVIGGVIIVLGMILMSGGKNQDANTFDTNEVYSTTRITIAPILIVLGLLVEVYAIFKKPKVKQP